MIDKIEIKEICDLKTGINCVFIGETIVKTQNLTSFEIFNKFKDYMTKEQIDKVCKNLLK